jgi:glycerol-3-phosphate dehydrogenase (NAD(P)+)
MSRISVIGAGSWGTALAIQLARAGSDVTLWGRNPDLLAEMQSARTNTRYLPGAPFPDSLHAEPDWDAALDGISTVLVSIPSHAFRQVLERLHGTFLQRDAALSPASAATAGSQIKLAWATKGLEMSSGLLPHQIVNAIFPQCRDAAVLSGPTFAKEVGQGLPTAITVASGKQSFAEEIAARLASPHFRAYTSSDIVGVEVGGAVKNALAIGAGLSDGLGFGANARVALINRGLREMTRLGVAMGASAETFMGLAGMGDLVLTCTDNQSRNRRMGLALAAGKTVAEAEAEIQQVVEGVAATRAVYEKAQALGVDTPIIEQICRVVTEGVDPQEAVEALFARATGAESD